MAAKSEILILASGNGTNAEYIVGNMQKKKLPANFTGGCNRTRANAGVYDKLEKLGVQVHYLPSPGDDFSKLRDFLGEPPRFDLVVMAGFMRILPGEIVKRNTVLNIHPSILPWFYMGSEDAYTDAACNGDMYTGCTVHMATEEVDAGPRMGQIGFEIPKTIRDSRSEAMDEELKRISGLLKTKHPKDLVEAKHALDSFDAKFAGNNLDLLKAVGLAHEHALYSEVIYSYCMDKPLDMNVVAAAAQNNLKVRGLPETETIIPAYGSRVFKGFGSKTLEARLCAVYGR